MMTYGPYSPIRQVGNLFFISGQVGIEPASKVAQADISHQTEQALKNLRDVLASEGLTMKHVVKNVVFLTDMADFAAVNQIYEDYFAAPRPARSVVGVRELPRVAGHTELLIEIEAVAYKETA